jgi:hypothetical protein
MMPAHQSSHCLCHHSRRWFLRAGLAGAIALPILGNAQTAQAQTPHAQTHHAKALVLSCIDFRVMEAEHDFLAQHHLGHQYDWTALAGASLALAGFPHTAETEAFWDQLDISQRLHHIERVIIFDHQDCGAYASKIDADLSLDQTHEQQVHADYLNRAYRAIKTRYPDLAVKLYFVRLDAEVRPILPLSSTIPSFEAHYEN